MITRRFAILFLCSFALAARATTWIATNGTALGSGVLSSPFSLWQVMTNTTAIQPGDTVYLRGGSYIGPGFNMQVGGTSNAYVTIQSYPGEWAVITDGGAYHLNQSLPNNSSDFSTLNVLGGNVAANWPIGIIVTIDQEEVSLRAPGDWARGWNGTTVAAHSSGSQVLIQAPFIDNNASYVRYQNFEITSADTNRIVNTAGVLSGSTPITNSLGCGLDLEDTGVGCKAIGLVVHNVGHPGIGFWEQGTGGEINGCLIYGNGIYDYNPAYNEPRGSGIYTQNSAGTPLIKDNIIFDNLTEGIHAYGQASTTIGYTFASNIFVCNANSNQCLLIGTTSIPASNNVVFNNFFGMNTPYLGYIVQSNQSLSFGSNWMVDTPGTIFVNQFSGAITNNTWLWNQASAPNEQLLFFTSPNQTTAQIQGAWAVDNNNYYSENLINNPTFEVFAFASTNLTTSVIPFATWQSDTGLDTHASYSSTWPASFQKVFVQQLDYNTNQYYVCAISSNATSAASLNLASLGFNNGDTYQVVDAQNWPAVVSSGAYAGGSISLSLGLTNLTSIPGVTNFAPKHSNLIYGGLFNAFILNRTPVGQGAIMPPERQAVWTGGAVGKAGGIPPRPTGTNLVNVKTTFGLFGDGIHDDTQGLLTAVTNLCNWANGHLMGYYLPAGTYLTTKGLNFPPDFSRNFTPQIAIYGDGLGGLANGGSEILWSNQTTIGNVITFTKGTTLDTNYFFLVGATKGATSFTVTSTNAHVPAPTYTRGTIISITQSNDPAFTYIETDGGSEGTNGSPCAYCGENGDRTAQQYTTVTGVSGNVISISEPLLFSFESAYGAACQAQFLGTNCGVQDITIERNPNFMQTDNGYNIAFSFMSGCWVSNTESFYSQGAHIQLNDAYRCDVDYNIIHGGPWFDSGQAYGVWLFDHSSNHKIVHNIFYNLRHGVVTEGGGAYNAFAYNFFTNMYAGEDITTFLGSCILFHGAHGWYNLSEGNVIQDFIGDLEHGSSSDNTSFRDSINTRAYVYHGTLDALPGIGGVFVTNQGGFNAIRFEAYNLSNSVVGDVISTNLYLVTNATVGRLVFGTPNAGLFDVAQPTVFAGGYAGASTSGDPIDLRVTNTFYYHANWDPLNGTYYNPANSDHSIPGSLLETWDGIFQMYSAAGYAARLPVHGPDLIPMVGHPPAEVRYNALVVDTNGLVTGNINWTPRQPWGFFLMRN